jgi:hypothetical protein
MSVVALSDGTRHRLVALNAPKAERSLQEGCADVPRPGRPPAAKKSLDWVRFAALRVSGGDLRRLRDGIAPAHVDWRDVLVAAGFGDDSLERTSSWGPT